MDDSQSSTFLAEPAAIAETRAVPFYFVSRDQTIFAWLHTPANGTACNHGVVLCPSLGHEQVHAYRGLRHLAESLASRGIAVLRFDWFGTGDSAGDDDSLQHVEHWLANVRDAVAMLKDKCGFERISLIGFRLGGLLAIEALANDERTSHAIENLVLWSPVTSGRSFTRELRLIGSTANAVAVPESIENCSLDAGGFRYSAETIDGLAALNMTRSTIACRAALVVNRDDLPADGKILPWLRANEVDAETRTMPGVKDLLVEPHFTKVPHEAIAEISNWLAKQTCDTWHEHPAHDLQHHQDARVTTPSASESIWQSGEPSNLMGVICEPPRNDKRRPLIVLLNSGAAYRVGASRLNVLISRRLAELGFRSLRVDFRGLGDSPVAAGNEENDTYPSAAFDDMAVVLRAAREELSHDRCVFLGLCSGAYFAFQAAAQFREPSLVESVLINPLTYYWCDGMTVDDPELREAVESHWRFTRKLDLQRIWKFLTGRSRIGYCGAARDVLGRLWHMLGPQATPQAWLNVESNSKISKACAPYGHPLAKDLAHDLLQVARRERKLTLFLADSDPGLTIMKSQAPREAKQLIRQGLLSVNRIADADHTFSRSVARNVLIEQIAAHLARRYL